MEARGHCMRDLCAILIAGRAGKRPQVALVAAMHRLLVAV
jgi:hypothetical protein